PVWIPKIYNGHDKTFFFVNFEQFRESQTINNQPITVPTLNYRDGNFQENFTTRTNIAVDPLERQIREGTIYDPLTQRLGPKGEVIRDPFNNNIIPKSQMDPVAVAIQNLIPKPTILNQVNNNGIYPYVSDRTTTIPAVKIDHSLSAKAKL